MVEITCEKDIRHQVFGALTIFVILNLFILFAFDPNRINNAYANVSLVGSVVGNRTEDEIS